MALRGHAEEADAVAVLEVVLRHARLGFFALHALALVADFHHEAVERVVVAASVPDGPSAVSAFDAPANALRLHFSAVFRAFVCLFFFEEEKLFLKHIWQVLSISFQCKAVFLFYLDVFTPLAPYLLSFIQSRSLLRSLVKNKNLRHDSRKYIAS